MSYDKKLLRELREYGRVTCRVCHKRTVENWNIYKNNICSLECSQRLIYQVLANPKLQAELQK